MAYVFRTYGCDGGGKLEEHSFELMQNRDEGPPAFCPKCGCRVSGSTPLPAKLSIGGSAIARAVDMTYRQGVEEASAIRAERAGNPALKVTDMNDHLREGDIAMKMPVNSVTTFMAQAGQRGVQYGWGGGMANGVVSLGGNPNPIPKTGWTGTGHPALASIQGDGGHAHQQMRQALARGGQINKTGPGT